MAVNEHQEPPGPADRRIAVLYREASCEEAPAHLDARLMAAAREGLAPRPAAARTPWWIAWRLPFAFAAVAVVSVSLVTLVMDEGGDRLTSEQPPVAAPPHSPPAAVAEAPPTVAEADASAPAPSAARKERALTREAPASERGAVTASAPASGPAVQDSQRRADAQSASGEAPAYQKAPEEVTTAIQAAPAPAAEPLAAPAARARADSSARDLEERAAPRPSAAAPPPPAAARRPEAALRRQEMGVMASKARPSPEVERLILELEGRLPSAWIDRITGLRRDGRTAEADGLLTEFRRRFPDEAVPPPLR